MSDIEYSVITSDVIKSFDCNIGPFQAKGSLRQPSVFYCNYFVLKLHIFILLTCEELHCTIFRSAEELVPNAHN